jgi:hypothetical protein
MAHQLAGVFPSWSGGRGTDHDPAWRAAVVMRAEVLSSIGPFGAVAAAASAAGLLALRTGHLLEEAVGALTGAP